MGIKQRIASLLVTVLLVGLFSGCDANQAAYKKAETLLNSGQYEEAAAAFDALGDYKDAPNRTEEARGGIREQQYRAAAALMEQEEYEQAAEEFEALGEYKDAPARAQEARDSTAYILIVKSVKFSGLGSVESIGFTDNDEAEIPMPSDWNHWFENASVDKVSLTGTLNMRINSQGAYDFSLADDSKLRFAFLVDGVEYPVGVAPGSRFAVKKTEGGYTLLPEKTAELSPPPAVEEEED